MISDASAEFPTFLHGSASEITRRLRTEAKRWARTYSETGALPEPEAAVVPAATTVYVENVFDQTSSTPAWRLYPFRNAAVTFLELVPESSYDAARAAFDRFCLTHPWSALAEAVGHSAPNSTANVSARIGAVLRFWDGLDSLRFVDVRPSPVTLPELLEHHYTWLLETWARGPGDPRTRLVRAVDEMRAAPPELVLDRILEVMQRIAQHDRKVVHREQVSRPENLERWVKELDQLQYDDLTACDRNVCRRYVLWFDERLT